jgi:putative transcriptional regulator
MKLSVGSAAAGVTATQSLCTVNGLHTGMSRSALVDNVTAMLRDAGFVVSDRCAIRPKSFDLAARRGDDLVLLKILGNVDAVDGETGAELRRLGTYLEATPMVVGMRTRDEDLKPEVVYFRHGVPALHPDTAYDLFVEGVPPLIYAAPGGLYVSIDGSLLADERRERGWSLGRLATELGVSRRTVSKYEDGMNASIEVAVRLEDLFGRPLSSPVDVLEGAEEVNDADPTPADPEADPDDEHVVAVLTRAGYTVHPTARSPFGAVTEGADENEGNLLAAHSAFDESARRRARLMASLGRVTRSRSVYFVEESSDRDDVDGTALVSRAELADTDEPGAVRELIRDRADEPAD